MNLILPSRPLRRRRGRVPAACAGSGSGSPARSVAIVAHGKPSSLRAFGLPVTFFPRKAIA